MRRAAYQKRMQEMLGPVYDDIGKALDVYAKAHGITLILDVTKIQGIVSAVGSLDITKAFITEFNSKNPATASLNRLDSGFSSLGWCGGAARLAAPPHLRLKRLMEH